MTDHELDGCQVVQSDEDYVDDEDLAAFVLFAGVPEDEVEDHKRKLEELFGG